MDSLTVNVVTPNGLVMTTMQKSLWRKQQMVKLVFTKTCANHRSASD